MNNHSTWISTAVGLLLLLLRKTRYSPDFQEFFFWKIAKMYSNWYRWKKTHIVCLQQIMWCSFPALPSLLLLVAMCGWSASACGGPSPSQDPFDPLGPWHGRVRNTQKTHTLLETQNTCTYFCVLEVSFLEAFLFGRVHWTNLFIVYFNSGQLVCFVFS